MDIVDPAQRAGVLSYFRRNSALNRPLKLLLAAIILAFSLSAADTIANDRFGQVASDELAKECLALNTGDEISVIVYLFEQADVAELDRELTLQRSTRQHRHQVIVDELKRVAEESQPELIALLEQLHEQGEVSGFTAYWIVNAVVVSGNENALQQIAEQHSVEWIDVNFHTSLTEPVDYVRGRSQPLDENHGVPTGIRAVGARRVWYELGITGAGRLVANIDTGVDGSHPALAGRWRGADEPASECWYDVIGNSQFPEDDSPSGGHGTHVMGTICGNSTASNDSIGVAPGAEWIACNAIDQGSSNEFDNDVLAAFQWYSDPDGNSATLDDVPDVVHNSWGVDGRFSGYSDCYQVWNQAIVNCEAAGVVVTFSAGNEGPSSRTLRSPATVEIDSVTVFSVGAVDANADTIPPYEIASFSSRGPTDCPPFAAIKPEVSAPGVDVYSSLPNGNYGRLSGTSMAGPHVAGIVALMREANPNAEVREIKSVLMRTAFDYGSAGEDNNFGFGFVDAYQAVVEISANRSIVTGTVTNEESGEPLRQATVSAGSRVRQTNVNGEYTLSLPGDSTWSLIYRAYGFLPDTVDVELEVAETLRVDVGLTALPQGFVHGVVRAGQSIPVAGAVVEFVGTPLPQLTTDANGEFDLAVPGDSAYTLEVSYSGVSDDTSFVVNTGGQVELQLYLDSPRAQPQGPDAYGYRAYDNLDQAIPPAFEWVEIAPSRGGEGTAYEIEDRDSSIFVRLPIQFQYYGQMFDSLTVNENGWVAAGISHDHSFFNFQIPSASGPPSMLALFWDNLQWISGTSELCVYHDTLHCRVIVEYLNFAFASAPDLTISCQLQVFDREARPTPTGDSEILMLWERLEIPNSATVGIENHSESAGVLCLFNGAFSNHTWSILPGSAILFTTRTQPQATGGLTGLVTAHPVPQDWSQAFVKAGCEYIAVMNGGAFNSNSVMTGNRGIEFMLPGYERAATVLRIAEDSVTQWSIEVWRLDPPRNLSGQTNNDTLILSWDPPQSTLLDEFLRYHLFRDGVLIGAMTAESYRDPIIGTQIRNYHLLAEYDGGVSDTSTHFIFDPTSSVSLPSGIPSEFAVSLPYPNPFNPVTEFTLALPYAGKVVVEVFDVLGRKAATVRDQSMSAGYHKVSWNATGLATGLYFVRVSTGRDLAITKVFLLK